MTYFSQPLKTLGVFLIIVFSNQAYTQIYQDYNEAIHKDQDDINLTLLLGKGYELVKDKSGATLYSADKRIMAYADFDYDWDTKSYTDHMDRFWFFKFDYKVKGYDANDFPIELPYGLTPDMNWLKCHKKLKKQKSVLNLTVIDSRSAKSIRFIEKVGDKEVSHAVKFDKEDEYEKMSSFSFNANVRWFKVSK